MSSELESGESPYRPGAVQSAGAATVSNSTRMFLIVSWTVLGWIQTIPYINLWSRLHNRFWIGSISQILQMNPWLTSHLFLALFVCISAALWALRRSATYIFLGVALAGAFGAGAIALFQDMRRWPLVALCTGLLAVGALLEWRSKRRAAHSSGGDWNRERSGQAAAGGGANSAGTEQGRPQMK